MTESRIGVAIGYFEADDWRTEGWWNIPSRECQDVIEGDLENRFYYFHAIDYDRGGGWNGSAILCIDDVEFTIDGRDDCLARGFDRAGFMEIDTQNSKNWQIQLTDPERTGAALQ